MILRSFSIYFFSFLIFRSSDLFLSIATEKLNITPNAQTISKGDAPKPFDGHFFDIPVHLGEIRTDEQGRLIVLGGLGVSGRTIDGE
jgi:hypothetical protein